MSDSARLDDVEVKLAHLERALLEISDVVARHQRELEQALARNRRLASLIEALESASGASAAGEEKPPHY